MYAKYIDHTISKSSILHYASNLDDLFDVACQRTGSQLQKIINVTQWLRSAILKFRAGVKILSDFLERFFSHVGKRTNRAVSRVPSKTLRWSLKHTHTSV